MPPVLIPAAPPTEIDPTASPVIDPTVPSATTSHRRLQPGPSPPPVVLPFPFDNFPTDDPPNLVPASSYDSSDDDSSQSSTFSDDSSVVSVNLVPNYDSSDDDSSQTSTCSDDDCTFFESSPLPQSPTTSTLPTSSPSHDNLLHFDLSSLPTSAASQPTTPQPPASPPTLQPTVHSSNPFFQSLTSIRSYLTKALLRIKTHQKPSNVLRRSDSQFRSLLPMRSTSPPPSLTKAETAVVSLLSEAIFRQRQAVAATFPSDGASTYYPAPANDNQPTASPPETTDHDLPVSDPASPLPDSAQASPVTVTPFHSDSFTSPPLLRPIDKVNSTLPATMTFTSEHLQKCSGFRNITSILPHIQSVAAPTVTFSDLGRDPLKRRG